MDILQYIQRMNQLYGTDPVPVRYNTQQYLQGGRVQYKPGGLVEPGVMYYGKARFDDPDGGIKAGDELGEGIQQYGRNKLEGYQFKKGSSESKRLTGKKPLYTSAHSYNEIKTKAEELTKTFVKSRSGPPPKFTWENLTKDPDFEIFFKEQIDVNPKVKELMEQANITKESTPEEIFKKIAIAKDKKGQLGTLTIANLNRRFDEVYKAQKGYLTLKEIAALTPYSEATLSRAMTQANRELPDINIAMKTKEGRKNYSNTQRAKQIMEQLKDAGVEFAPIEPAGLRRTAGYAKKARFKGQEINPFTGGVKFGKNLFVKPTEDVAVKLKNMVKLAGTTDSSLANPSSWRHNISKQSKATPEYKKHKYDIDTGNRKTVINALNRQLDMMNDVQLRMYVASNPKLKDMVLTEFDNANGNFFKRDLSDLTDQEIRTRVRFEDDHIRPMSSVKQDPYTKKVVDGLKVEYPRNFQILPKAINYPAKWDAEKWMKQNIGKKDPETLAKLKNIDNWFANRGLSYYADGKIRGSTTKGLLTEGTQKLGIDLEKVLKTKRLDPYGKPLVEGGEQLLGSVKEREKVAKILSNNFDCEFHGKLGGPAKCNDPRAYIKSINEVKAKAIKGDVDSLNKFKKVANNMRKLKGTATWTGWGILGEIGFALPFAAMDYQAGLTAKRILGNATLNLLGQSEQEELLSYLPEKSLGAAQMKTLETAERAQKLAERNFPGARIGMDQSRFNLAQHRVKEAADQDFRDAMKPFVVNGVFDYEAFTRAGGDVEAARAQIEKDTLARKEERKMDQEQMLSDYYQHGLFNTGGRVGFKLGGIDKGRRAFMKWLAGITGTTIAAGTGLIKWGKVAGKGKTVVKAADHVVQGTSGMPDWFIPLINRIVKEGDDVTAKLATKEREIVHTKKIDGHDVDVYQNLDTGDIRVVVEGGTGKHLTAYDGGLELEYRAGEVIEEGMMKGKKTNPDFNVAETEAGYYRTGPEDSDLDISFNTQGRPTKYDKKSGTVVVDESKATTDGILSDTNFLKNYAKNKKSNMGEIVETTKKKQYNKHLDDNPHEDPRIPEGPEPDVGMDEFGNLVDDYGEIID